MQEPVGLIGTGRMGTAIGLRLLAQGRKLVVYNRSPARAQTLQAAGAELAATPARLASRCALVLSSLVDAKAVDAVCDGPDGLLAAWRGGLHLSTSTLAPRAAARLAARHADAGAVYVSMPVQGRPPMAEAGQLVAWLSGAERGVAAMQVIELIARKVIDLGPDPAHAPAAKLALNMLMNTNIMAFAEACGYVASHGVPAVAFTDGLTETAFAAPLFKAIAAGLAAADDRANGGSDVAVAVKDLGLLLDSAPQLTLPLSAAAASAFRDAAAAGWADHDPCAVRRIAGVRRGG